MSTATRHMPLQNRAKIEKEKGERLVEVVQSERGGRGRREGRGKRRKQQRETHVCYKLASKVTEANRQRKRTKQKINANQLGSARRETEIERHTQIQTHRQRDRQGDQRRERKEKRKYARLSNDQRYTPTHQDSYSHTCAKAPKEKGDNTAHTPLAWGSETHVDNESGREKNGKGKPPH